MAADLSALIDDLEAEQVALRDVLVALPGAQWELATHAPGWSVGEQVAHLAFFDEAAARAIRDPDGFAHDARRTARREPTGEPAYLVEARLLAPGVRLAAWEEARTGLLAAARTLAAEGAKSPRLPWFGPPMSAASFLTARLMETWSHGLDVVDVVGVPRPPTDRLRHVATLGVLTRSFSYSNRGRQADPTPVYVELIGPSGDRWAFGDPRAEALVRGSAEDFCQVVTQRRHVADTALQVTGAPAEEWMELAQAFAGPPGAGRQPGQFPRQS